MVPGWLAGLGEEIGIQPVAVVPSRDMMLIADERDNAAVLWVLEEGMKIFADHPRWLSPVPYEADEDGDIVPWRPEQGHPAFAAVRLAERTLETYEYREQKNRLEKLFRQAGEDLLVGDYDVDFKAPRSVTTWPQANDALLPYADEIIFPAEVRPVPGHVDQCGTAAQRRVGGSADHATAPPDPALAGRGHPRQAACSVLGRVGQRHDQARPADEQPTVHTEHLPPAYRYGASICAGWMPS